MRHLVWFGLGLLCTFLSIDRAIGADAASLRLVPFPKDVAMRQGTFALDRPLVLEAPRAQSHITSTLIEAELARIHVKAPKSQPADADAFIIRLSPAPGSMPPAPGFRQGASNEDYELRIQPEAISIVAPGTPGLLHGVRTLCQLIRANRLNNNSVPCLTIRDWPSLRWRCFQDDLTRGPSSTLATLKNEIAIGASLKFNVFTYYMEYQFAFKKHPMIGPKDGSLQPEDLKAMVEYARPLGIDILGNQQSFGHFSRILQHPQYAALRETGDVLSPAKDETYRLLDDLYSEVCPLLPFEYFNVCCDETYGLGEGPAKELVKKIGIGGAYVRHIRRIHDLLKDKYHKRMMMWGDIILQHPDHLNTIPKDTIMLTWGYDPRASFDKDILPFAKSGYEFWVCPGVSNWSRILPDFGAANTNIRNFVRDGVKNGAAGMLNTSWEDDGEALKGVIWYGHAWAAECAWNASKTEPADFNRRVGAMLFGENSDHFGQAIALLAQTHRLPGMNGMNNSRFWQNDFLPKGNSAAIEASAKRLLELVRPAIERLEACKREATINANLLDSYILGARRMELIAQRMLDGISTAQYYAEAHTARQDKALELIDKARALVIENRDAHAAIGKEFARLWVADCRPYALDWTTQRYDNLVRWYDALAAKLAEARTRAESGKPLPTPQSLGLGEMRAADQRR